MFVDLKEKLRNYVEAFNASDDELYAQEIPNAPAQLTVGRNSVITCP